MKQNRALVIEQPGTASLQARPLPQPAGSEVLVEVCYVALCGSDVKLFAGSYTAPHNYPLVPGHEWLGHITECGADVANLAPGDIVTGDCSLYCGRCTMCATNPNHCDHIQKSGITVDGRCSNFALVGARHIYKCPPLDDPLPFVLAEPAAVGANGLARLPRAEAQRARTAVVLGAGGIGMLALLSLCELPLERIVVADPLPEKRAMVEQFGLARVETSADVQALPSDAFDIVVEAAGQTVTLQACPRLAAPAGHIVLLGHQGASEVDFGAIVKKSLTVHASHGSTGGFEDAIRIIQKQPDIVRRLITRMVPLDDAPGYISDVMPHERNIKVVIDLR